MGHMITEMRFGTTIKAHTWKYWNPMEVFTILLEGARLWKWKHITHWQQTITSENSSSLSFNFISLTKSCRTGTVSADISSAPLFISKKWCCIALSFCERQIHFMFPYHFVLNMSPPGFASIRTSAVTLQTLHCIIIITLWRSWSMLYCCSSEITVCMLTKVLHHFQPAVCKITFNLHYAVLLSISKKKMDVYIIKTIQTHFCWLWPPHHNLLWVPPPSKILPQAQGLWDMVNEMSMNM